MTITILMADNQQAFTDVRSAFLENAGYKVIRAYSLAQAERELREAYIHLAILDVRLVNDDDENDISGITLAQSPDFRAIPKIILTAYPSYQTASVIFGQSLAEMPPFVKYLSKKDGPKVMVKAVQQVVEQYVRINFNLDIRWNPKQPLSFPGLVGLIEPGLPPEQLSTRVSEMEDLFRKLFFQSEQATVWQLFWTRKGRGALEVLTYSETGEEQYVVICGTTGAMQAEIENDQRISHRLQQTGGLSTLEPVESVHYAIRGRTLPGNQTHTEEIKTLAAYFQARPAQTKAVVENLLHNTLASWLNNERNFEEDRTLAQCYREKFNLTAAAIPGQAFRQKLAGLGRECALRGLAEIGLQDEEMTIRFPGNRTVRLKDPLGPLYDDELAMDIDVMCHRSPGGLDAETVLVDPAGNTWLSDFSTVDIAPLWDNFAALECSLRFGSADLSNLQSLYEMEKCLLAIKRLSDMPPIDSVDPEYRKLAGILQAVHAQSAGIVDDSLLPYLVSMYFYVIAPLAAFDSANKYTYPEVQVLFYRMMLSGLLAEKINAQKTAPATQDPMPGAPLPLVIKEDSHEVFVGSRQVTLTPTEYKLLRYLYQSAGKVCLRDDIARDVFTEAGKEPVDEESKINTNVRRIRRKIEPDADQPIYLQTIRSTGFKLLTHQS